MPDPVHLSASQISSLGHCGEQYRLERVEGKQAYPGWARMGGRAVHGAFEDIVRNDLNADEAEEAFLYHLSIEMAEADKLEPDRTLWIVSGRKSKDWPEKENLDWWLAKGPEQSRKFATIYGTPFLPGHVVVYQEQPLIEVAFDITIGAHQVKGFIDAIVIDDRERYVPRDYKAGSMTPVDPLQLAVYAEATRQLYGVKPTVGQYLMTRTMKIVEMDLGAWDEAELVRQFDMAALMKKHAIYVPRVSNMCSACGVRRFCKFVKEVK